MCSTDTKKSSSSLLFEVIIFFLIPSVVEFPEYKDYFNADVKLSSTDGKKTTSKKQLTKKKIKNTEL